MSFTDRASRFDVQRSISLRISNSPWLFIALSNRTSAVDLGVQTTQSSDSLCWRSKAPVARYWYRTRCIPTDEYHDDSNISWAVCRNQHVGVVRGWSSPLGRFILVYCRREVAVCSIDEETSPRRALAASRVFINTRILTTGFRQCQMPRLPKRRPRSFLH